MKTSLANKFLKQSVIPVGSMKLLFEHYNEEARLVIPVLGVQGKYMMNLSLIYNMQQQNENSYLFGKSLFLDVYGKITHDSNSVVIQRADGYSYAFNKTSNEEEFDGVMFERYDPVFDNTNKFTMYYSDELSQLVLVDKAKNKYYYDSISGSSSVSSHTIPSKVVGSGIGVFTISNIIGGEYIYSNAKGDSIYLKKTGDKVSEIIVKHGNTVVAKTVLSYSNERINTIKYYYVKDNVDQLLEHYEFQLINSSKSWSITEKISGIMTTLFYNTSSGNWELVHNKSLKSIRSNQLRTITFKKNEINITPHKNYIEYKTIDTQGYPIYEMDDNKNILAYEYDSNGQLIRSSGLISYDDSIKSNLCSNGDFTNNTTDWIINGTGQVLNEYSSNIPAIFGSKRLLIGDDTVVEQRVLNKANKGENLRVSFFARQETLDGQETYILFVKLRLKKGNSTLIKDVTRLPMDHFDTGKYGLVFGDYKFEDDYDSVDLLIISEIYNEVSIRNVKVSLSKDTSTNFAYDQFGNMIDVKTKKENFMYYDNNLLIGQFANDEYVMNRYNDKCMLETTINSDSVRKFNEYDTGIETYSNLLNSRTYSGNKFFENSYVYNLNGKYVTEETKTNDAKYTYVMDEAKNLLTSVKNIYDEINSFIYDSRRRLVVNRRSNASTYSDVRTYYSGNSTTFNSYPIDLVEEYYSDYLSYKFEYNNEFKIKKITKTDLETNNSKVLIQYFYDYELDSSKYISDNVVKIIDETNSETLFTYDSYNNLISVTKSNQSVNFTYDKLNRLLTKKEKKNGTIILTTSYTYDDYNNVTQVSNSNLNVLYSSNDESSKRRAFGYEETIFSSKYKNTLYKNMKSIFDNEGAMYCTFEKELITNSNGEKVLLISDKLKDAKGKDIELLGGKNTVHNDKFGYLNCDTSNFNKYVLKELDNNKQRLTFSFDFFVESGKSGYLFTIAFSDSHKLYAKIVGTKLNIYATNSTFIASISTFNIELDKWNSFSIALSIDSNNLTFDTVLNDQQLINKNYSYSFSVTSSIPELYFGSYPSNTSVTSDIQSLFTNIFIYPEVKLSVDTLLELNKERCKFMEEKVGDVESNKIYTTSLMHKTSSLDSDEYPLNNTYKGFNGYQKFNLCHENNETKQFIYDDEIKKEVFNASGNVLRTKHEELTVSLSSSVKFNNSGYKNVIYNLLTDGYNIELYKDTNGILTLKYNNQVLTTPYFVDINKWHTLGISVERLLDSESIEIENINIKVIYDGEAFETQLEGITDSGYFDIYVGADKDKTSFTDGLISELRTFNVYLSDERVQKDFANDEIIRYHHFNALNQLVEDGIKTKTRTITKNQYEYKHVGDRNLTTVSKVVQDNVQVDTDFDKKGNVTKLGNISYTFDYLNRLTKAQGNGVTHTYEYDDFGNLKIKARNGQTTLFTYNGDKLLSYGSNTISYDSFDRIISLGNMSLSWDRDKLVSITNLGQTFTYEYDINGLRTKKINGTNVINYTYEGDLLVKQDDGVDKVLYLYDENNILYGLIWNDEKYFYKRNLIGEITDIIDFNGNSVVKYSYDQFGKVESVTGTKASTLGVINSMLYKGYYYDVETQLIYCNSRYYSPELCRWISPDSIEYLDPESINGLNLYAYCGNDPINRYDPTGHAWDFILDIFSIGWSLYDFIKDPSWENFGWLALDVVFAVVPFLTGSRIMKAASKLDDVSDIGGYMNKFDNVYDSIVIGNDMGRVTNLAFDTGSMIYDGYKPMNALYAMNRADEITDAMKYAAKVDNARFIMDKYKAGYKIINAGSDGRGFFKMMKSAYGMELKILYRLKYGNKLHKLWWILNSGRRIIW